MTKEFYCEECGKLIEGKETLSGFGLCDDCDFPEDEQKDHKNLNSLDFLHNDAIDCLHKSIEKELDNIKLAEKRIESQYRLIEEKKESIEGSKEKIEKLREAIEFLKKKG